MFKTLIVILMTSVLVNNYVLNRFLGICPFLGVSKKLNQAVGMGVAGIFVMLLATLVTWPIQRFLLEPNDLGYMQTIIFIYYFHLQPPHNYLIFCLPKEVHHPI